MPLPNHRIDVLLMSCDPDHEITDVEWDVIRDNWSADGWTDGSSSSNHLLVSGGCKRVRLDQPGRKVLYANQQGGFRVQCPDTDQNIAGRFGVALAAWKRGGPESMDCPSCGNAHDLAECVLSPPGAFGHWAIVFADAEGASCTEGAQSAVESVVGPVCQVVRRLI